MNNKYKNRISPITEVQVAFCDKCGTAQCLEVKQLKDGRLVIVCGMCSYRNPNWK